VRATFTEEQEALTSAARDLAEGGRQAARAALEGRDLPQEPTATLTSGYSGLAVPEENGGLGGGLVELGIVLEALGREVTPTPWVSHVLAVQVAYAAGFDVRTAAAGERRWALAESWNGAHDRTGTGDDAVLLAVPDGAGADAFVVLTDERVLLVEPQESSPRPAFDVTRPVAEVRGSGPPVAEAGRNGTDPAARAVAALSAELVGVGRGAVDLAVGYATEREQFGRPIGRFQGVAHQLADAWTGVESAWSLALYACWAVDAGSADAGTATHAAKARAGEAAVYAAERGMQVHGGIGITWEADPHLYLRRAIDGDRRLRPARVHRRRLGEALVAAVGTGP
jgi:alkylation response protein AidB-like acyl-CoA dehydrogenase